MVPKHLSKLFLSLLLFGIVFAAYAVATRNKSFGVDDLGYIINGQISSLKDIPRVFTDDARNYSKTYNYNYPQSNFLSGFLRPMQHIFLSITHSLFGLNPYAFALLHVLLHTLNTILFFILLSMWFSSWLSFFGALLFAFYPDMSWLTWFCTLQSSLMLFFLLLSIIFYTLFLKKNRSIFYYTSGVMFLLSLLSRENPIFLALWPFVFFILFSKKKSFFASCIHAFSQTWIFFLSTMVYTIMKLYAFGLGSLGRTGYNILIRFGLAKGETITNALSKIPSNLSPPAQATQAVTKEIATQSIIHKLLPIGNKFMVTSVAWLKRLFPLSEKTLPNKILLLALGLFFILFFLYSYKKQFKTLFSLGFGGLLVIWPCILVYPDVRYMNPIYPLLIFMIFLGLSFLRTTKSSLLSSFFRRTSICLMIFFLFTGFLSNIISSAKIDPSREINHYELLFDEHPNLPRKTSFLFLSVPGEADLQETLQYVSNNKNIKAALAIITRLCHDGGYRTTNTRYKVEPCKKGFTFTSLAPAHCGWDFRSYQPVRWSKKEKSFVLSPSFFQTKKWYACSVGRFFIHEVQKNSINKKVATKFSIVFDKKWMKPNTIFVIWDTKHCRYKILDATHLKKKGIAP
jgi:hypothetical protein